MNASVLVGADQGMLNQGPQPLMGRASGMAGRSTAEVSCPRSMVGRVIGKNGETIKALQTYTGALIQIDQSTDPTRVTISGTAHSLNLAIAMVSDICKGTFKGFALLRQLIQPQRQPAGPSAFGSVVQPRPVYAPGYGLIPPSQLYGAEDPNLPVGTMPQQLVGQRPLAVQLQPGFQYMQQGGETPLMMGMAGSMPTHAITQQMDGTLLSSMPMQQLPMQPMQPVYSAMPGGGYAAQVAYYPQDYSSGVNPGEQLLYPQPDGTLLSLQQAQLGGMHTLAGSNTGKMLAGAGQHVPSQPAMRQVRPAMQPAMPPAGAPRWSSGNGWVEAKVEPTTMGQHAVSDLLGGPSGSSQAMGTQSTMGQMSGPAGQASGGSGQQQLVQLIGPEGKVSYFLQGSDH